MDSPLEHAWKIASLLEIAGVSLTLEQVKILHEQTKARDHVVADRALERAGS